MEDETVKPLRNRDLVIPRVVINFRACGLISDTQAILLALIEENCDEEGWCYATDKELAAAMGLHTWRSATGMISYLEGLVLLKVQGCVATGRRVRIHREAKEQHAEV